ncbi:MAG: hypothetical protein JNG88_11975 [Phycisphaerales bacterium]|nr:hypothetical protein [Phycisphaerales bacterium]
MFSTMQLSPTHDLCDLARALPHIAGLHPIRNGPVWLINHPGGTVLRCVVLDFSPEAVRLRAPLGYGIAEGQEYELSAHLPGEFDSPAAGSCSRVRVVVRRAATAEAIDDPYVEVDLAEDHCEAAMSAF